jgi:hypothetical protein
MKALQKIARAIWRWLSTSKIDPAAPVGAIPQSEAITKVEGSDPEKSK